MWRASGQVIGHVTVVRMHEIHMFDEQLEQLVAKSTSKGSTSGWMDCLSKKLLARASMWALS